MIVSTSFQTEHVLHPRQRASALGPVVRHLQGADLRRGDAALLRRVVLRVMCQVRDNLLWKLSPLSGKI